MPQVIPVAFATKQELLELLLETFGEWAPDEEIKSRVVTHMITTKGGVSPLTFDWKVGQPLHPNSGRVLARFPKCLAPFMERRFGKEHATQEDREQAAPELNRLFGRWKSEGRPI